MEIHWAGYVAALVIANIVIFGGLYLHRNKKWPFDG